MLFNSAATENNANINIENSQIRQRASYAKRHIKADILFKAGDKVLLKNLKRDDKKGGWSLMPWIGPFVIESLSDNHTCILKKGDRILKTKQHIKNIKNFFERAEENFDDPTDEISISTEDVLPVKKTPFRPVSKLWMTSKCKELGIPSKSNYKCVAKKSTKCLSKPKQTIDVIGDGNCWFRCISIWLTESEDYHELIRSRVYKV